MPPDRVEGAWFIDEGVRREMISDRELLPFVFVVSGVCPESAIPEQSPGCHQNMLPSVKERRMKMSLLERFGMPNFGIFVSRRAKTWRVVR